MGSDWTIDRTVIRDGHITLLVGANGSGKTTLLESLAGLRPLPVDRVSLGNEPLWISKRTLNRKVLLSLGISLQNAGSQWFAGNVKRELEYSLKPYSLTSEEQAQRIVVAMDQVGLDTVLLERDPWTLSGGQQRRLALACLLACRPHWLLLDEPMAGLDAEGIERLCSILLVHKRAGRGAIIVTHDPAALLSLADEVIVMKNGYEYEVVSAAVFAERLVVEAGSAAPQEVRTVRLLSSAGFVMQQLSGDGVGADDNGTGADSRVPWLSPEQLAEQLAGQMEVRLRGRRESAAVTYTRLEQDNVSGHAANIAGVKDNEDKEDKEGKKDSQEDNRDNQAKNGVQSTQNVPERTSNTVSSRQTVNPSFIQQLHNSRSVGQLFDPRALLLAYMLTAAGILQQKEWMGAGGAAVLLAPILWTLRNYMKPYSRVVRAYIVFIGFVALLAGLQFQPLSFDFAAAAAPLLRLGVILLVMLISLPLLSLTTPFRIQRGVEQSLGWSRKLRIPVDSLALVISLMFRFIPLVGAEWNRFARIACARGKSASRPGTVPPALLTVALIPFLLSMLRLSESIADALEAKGFGDPKAVKTTAIKLIWTRRDSVLLAAAMIFFVIAYVISIIDL